MEVTKQVVVRERCEGKSNQNRKEELKHGMRQLCEMIISETGSGI